MRFSVAAAVLFASVPAVGLAQDDPSSLERVVMTPAPMPQPVINASLKLRHVPNSHT